jgi:preprotein translocase subunit YajC
MLNFNFLLETTANPTSMLPTILIFGGVIALMYFMMIRPQKKQEKKDAEMRNALAVGDEVTTIGGIIGKVVAIKEETFVLETTKDRTKIRFLRGAIRSVDVKIADIAAAQAAEKTESEAPAEEK